MKIVMIGAGSYSFGRGQIADIIYSKELKESEVTLTLVDINEENLDRMYNLALRFKEDAGASLKIEKTTDRKEALPGTDYVIISIAIRRMELWEQDFRLPRSYGFRHQYAENGGPAGLFHALRNLNIIIPICRDVEQLCPNAFLLNFTNPEARILHAITTLTSVKAAGFCHGVFSAMYKISEMLNRPIDSFKVTSGGINHIYAVKNVIDKENGKDMIEDIKTRALQSDLFPPLFKKMLEVFDVFLFPDDGHIGEFLPFAHEFTGMQWPWGIESRKVGVPKEMWHIPVEELNEYAYGKKSLDDNVCKCTEELTVPVICDIELDRNIRREAVNVRNTEGFIENLQRDGVVELPASIDKDGLHPEHYGEIPEPFASFMRRQLDINIRTTEAFRTQSRKELLQILLIDPMTESVSRTEKMLDDFLRVQKDFLPEFE